MLFSIIVPVLNEGQGLKPVLESLQPCREVGHSVIVVDGGSVDDTNAVAGPLVDKLLSSEPGRALQMNAGAAVAEEEWLLFLHADTLISLRAIQSLHQALGNGKILWGRFDVRLSGERWLFRVIEFLINLRSRVTSVATGDQAMFVRRDVFERLGGYASIPLMEDVELSKRLRKLSKPLCISDPISTSSRRWETQGVLRTVLLMWRLRLRYFLGTSPETLARSYQN